MAARKEWPRPVQALVTGAGVAVISILLQFAGALQHLELKTRDLRMRWTQPPKVAATQFDHSEIAIILITDESIEWLQKESNKPWPWPREVFGFLFRAAALGKARGILFDMFTHLDRDVWATEGQWAKDIRNSPPSFLATQFKVQPDSFAD